MTFNEINNQMVVSNPLFLWIIPVHLKDAGIGEERFEEMAKKATERGPLGNFVKLSRKEIYDEIDQLAN